MAQIQPFTGQNILITGAGSGIGRATSIRLAESGASLTLSDINLSSLAETAAICGQCISKNASQKHSVHVIDISNSQAVEALLSAAIVKHGRLDHVFNCAGINPTLTSIVDTSDSYFHKLVSVNLQGTFNVCRASVPYLNRGASIVNVSSMSGVQPPAGMAVYAATKAGVIGMSKALALELGPKGVRVNVVAPGDINTATNNAVTEGPVAVTRSEQKIAMGRLGETGEVADAVMYLFLNGYVNGTVVEVHGGFVL